jgi:hypothetical protein
MSTRSRAQKNTATSTRNTRSSRGRRSISDALDRADPPATPKNESGGPVVEMWNLDDIADSTYKFVATPGLKSDVRSAIISASKEEITSDDKTKEEYIEAVRNLGNSKLREAIDKMKSRSSIPTQVTPFSAASINTNVNTNLTNTSTTLASTAYIAARPEWKLQELPQLGQNFNNSTARNAINQWIVAAGNSWYQIIQEFEAAQKVYTEAAAVMRAAINKAAKENCLAAAIKSYLFEQCERKAKLLDMIELDDYLTKLFDLKIGIAAVLFEIGRGNNSWRPSDTIITFRERWSTLLADIANAFMDSGYTEGLSTQKELLFAALPDKAKDALIQAKLAKPKVFKDNSTMDQWWNIIEESLRYRATEQIRGRTTVSNVSFLEEEDYDNINYINPLPTPDINRTLSEPLNPPVSAASIAENNPRKDLNQMDCYSCGAKGHSFSSCFKAWRDIEGRVWIPKRVKSKDSNKPEDWQWSKQAFTIPQKYKEMKHPLIPVGTIPGTMRPPRKN